MTMLVPAKDSAPSSVRLARLGFAAAAVRAGRTRLLWAAVLFALIVALSLANLVSRRDVPGSAFRGGAALCDFRDAFYYPGVALLEGHNPYASIDYLDRYPVAHAYPLYSPATLLLHLPFSLLPYRGAQALFVVCNLALLLWLSVLALRLAGVTPSLAAALTVAAVLLSSRPGQQNLFLGQCTFYVVAGAYLALLEARRRPWLAALGLALAAIKPTTAVPVAALMLWRGEQRAVLAAAVVSAAAVAVMLVPLLQIDDPTGWLAALQENLRIFRHNPAVNPLTSPDRSDLAALFGRLIDRPLSALEGAAFAAALVTVAGVALRRKAAAGANDLLSDALLCVTAFVCIYHLPYDALLLSAPAVALVYNPSALPALTDDRRRRRWAIALIAVIGWNYFASERGIEALGGAGWWLITALTSTAGGVLFFLTLTATWRTTEPRLRFPRRSRLEPTGPVDWIAHYDHFGPGLLLRRRLNWVADALPPSMQRVLEIGYGSGVFQYELARRAEASVGVDIHPNAARVARRLAEDGVDASLLQGDGTSLPFRSASFDAVVILSSLEFVADPAACLRECRRVLRPGGRFVCVRPRQSQWIDMGFRLLMRRDPESEFAGGRARVARAVEQTLAGAQHLLRPLGWTRWLAPYEVIVFDRPRTRPTDALALDASIE